MGHQVGIRELRQKTSELMKRVSTHGETIQVTDHGHPIARIVPLKPNALDQLVLEGRATAASGDLLDLAADLGLPSRESSRPSAALAALRADER